MRFLKGFCPYGLLNIFIFEANDICGSLANGRAMAEKYCDGKYWQVYVMFFASVNFWIMKIFIILYFFLHSGWFLWRK
jgi:hypothetical protein